MAEPTARSKFLNDISNAHYACLARCILVTGNIGDLFPMAEEPGTVYASLGRVLYHTLREANYRRRGAKASFIVMTLKGDGIRFETSQDAADLNKIAKKLSDSTDGEHKRLGSDLSTVLDEIKKERTDSLVTFTVIAGMFKIFADLRKGGEPVAPLVMIMDYADMLFPAGDVARMGEYDRDRIKCMCDLLRDEEIWPDGGTAEERPDLLILMSPTVSQINERIASLPKTVQVEVTPPDPDIQRAFIERRLVQFPASLYPEREGNAIDAFVGDARGLTLRNIDDMIVSSHRLAHPINRVVVVDAVNRALKGKLGDVITISRPDHTMKQVIGFGEYKKHLAQLRIRIDDPERAPAGITVVGPNGAGKTFLFEAWAGETGRTVITIGNIRNELFGKTDALGEQFASIVPSLGRSMILVDEAHVAFGSMHARDTHETERRLTGRIIQMMDDTSHRSNIVWVLITTRPDLLDPDMVRGGRCSFFMPIFDPEGKDAEAFFQWMLQRLGKDGVTFSAEDQTLIHDRAASFCAGDYREFPADLAERIEFMRKENEQFSLPEFLASWTSTSDTIGADREMQILLAAQRCSWRELLPERYKDTPREDIRDCLRDEYGIRS